MLNLSNIRARAGLNQAKLAYIRARATWVGSLMFLLAYASVRLIKNVVALQKVHSQVRRSPYKLALSY